MKIRFPFILIVAAILSAGCREKVEEPFAFTVSCDSVDQGQPLPVRVSITRGSHEGYSISCSVMLYDASTGSTAPTEYVLCHIDGTPIGREVIAFEDYGRRDFIVPDVEPGTYMVVVTILRDGRMMKASSIGVVRDTGGGDEPPVEPPVEPENILVSELSIPDMELVESALSIDCGKSKQYALVWSPENATLIDFVVTSSDESVVVATISNGIVTIQGIAVGSSTVTITAEGGASLSFVVSVQPDDVNIDSFQIVGLDESATRTILADGDTKRYALTWAPSDANVVEFAAVSSNPDVVAASIDENELVLNPLYPGDATITVSAKDGPVKSFQVRNHKDVVVKIEWEELNATDSQIAHRTFPCQLKFSSDSNKAFPTPVVWTITLKGVINVPNKDAVSEVVKKDVSFKGNRIVYFDVCEEFLYECWTASGRTPNYSLSITLSIQRNDSFDADFWGVTYDESFKTQNARINDYITSILQ